MTDYLDLGSWNAVCWECGRKRKANELRKNWKGYYVCAEHWEPRQPQDFVRAVPESQAAPWSQPPSDVFTFGDALITESSDLVENLDYILTETSYPITTE